MGIEMMIQSRAYASEEDYARMRRLLVDIYATGGAPVYCTIGDLDMWRFTDDDPAAVALARLWFDGDELIGFTWPGDDQVDMMVHPRHRAIEEQMLAWAEQRSRAAGPSDGARLRAWSFARDEVRNMLLQQRGYQRTDTFLSYRSFDLDQPLAEPRVPPGYVLRNVQGEADLDQRVAVHRDAFAPSRMTVAKHQAVMRAPTYRPELDLVVAAPDGTFAAFSIVWFDEANRLGVFEPVGCHSAHRRRGLGTALLREGMRRLKALGAHTAEVNGLGSESGGTLLYEATGFREVDRNYRWVKLLV